jgi:hypothetical protein
LKYVLPLLAILVVSLFTPFIEVANSTVVGGEGDHDKINISVKFYPDTDKYGHLSVNPDGSFYPNDQFWMTYKTYISGNIDFEGVEVVYDQSAFEKVRDSGWGGLSGMALFRVKATASPGTYTFTVKAWGSETFKLGSAASGTVKVTYGGVEVNTYYTAECMLTISASSGGTTNPALGSYWYTKGTQVSVTAIPDTNYQLDHWLLDGNNAGSSNPITVTMGSPHTLKAVFRRIQYSLSISATSGGTTSPSPGTYYYDAGTYASVSAIPYANYTFSHWVLDESDAGSSNPKSVFMDAAHSLTAVFETVNASSSATSLGVAVLGVAVRLNSLATEPKLVIKDLDWTTWFDLFRGTVCQAKGYLYDSNGNSISYSDIVVEFRKMNFWTGATWVVQKTVKTNRDGYFVAEDTCNPLSESFIGVRAWAEKPGYVPSWSLSLYLDPVSGEVGQGESLITGVRVHLDGRFTSVPISFVASGLPQSCSASFDPAAGGVDGLTPFEGIMLLSASPVAPLGDYTLSVTASSGKVSSTAQFSLKVTSPIKEALSGVRFTAYGLDGDATGVALTLDGNSTVYAEQLPYAAYWNVGSAHSFSWSSQIGSKLDGKKYVLSKVEVVEHYVSTATVTVEVVKYDPHFTVLAYTIPKSEGNHSYEKPFAMIIRYDGNGPEYRLDQRAVIEGWDWWGYASNRMLQQHLFSLPLDPSKMSVEELMKIFQSNSSLFNMFTEKGVQFSVTGIEKNEDAGKTEGVVLKVDGEELKVEDLPKKYDWPANSTHTYEWSMKMPVMEWDPTGTYLVEADDEWYGWDNTYVFPPPMPENVTDQKHVEELILAALNSPKGTVSVTQFSSRVMGAYAYNKLLSGIASDAGVAQAVNCLTPETFPMYFDNENRYAKVAFQLDQKAASEALKQLFNSSVYYDITFKSSIFVQHSFKANFTCPLEYYRKTVNATAWHWDPIGERFVADHTVAIEAVFDTAFNFTEKEVLESWFKEQAVGETVLNMALEDIYECPPQYVFGLSPTQGTINRTSPLHYNINATAGWGLWTIGDLPESEDAWTESLKPTGAYWSPAPKSKLHLDQTATYGHASIGVSAESTEWPGAILYVLKPAVSAGSKLTFEAFLGGGCTGEVTVYIKNSHGTRNETVYLPSGSWQTVSIHTPPGRISIIGIYAHVSGDQDLYFRIDDLRLAHVRVWRWIRSVTVQRTVSMDFRTDEPYRLYVNFDPSSPLPVNVTSDDCKRSELTINALPQLGGLENVTVYLVTSAPTGYSLKNIPIERLTLKPLLAMNLTAPQEKVQGVENFTYYQGYSSIYTSALGFQGNATVSILKDPEVKALPYYNASLLVIEAQNVWGTKFFAAVAVQPYGKTYYEVLWEQIAMVIGGVAIAAVIIGLVIHFLREARGS